MTNDVVSSFGELYDIIDNLPKSMRNAVGAMLASHDCRERALALILIEILSSKRIDTGLVYRIVCEE